MSSPCCPCYRVLLSCLAISAVYFSPLLTFSSCGILMSPLYMPAVYTGPLYRSVNYMTGVYVVVLKRYLSPPPPQKLYFFPLSKHVVFQLLLCPFCLNSSLFCIYFTFYFPFALFLYPFHFFLSSVLLFLINFSLFHIFPPNYIG